MAELEQFIQPLRPLLLRQNGIMSQENGNDTVYRLINETAETMRRYNILDENKYNFLHLRLPK